MLSDAPSIENILPNFFKFVGSDILIGHNVNFDINFIYDHKIAFDGTPFKNDYLDTLRLSRKVLSDLPHHRLKDITKYYSINFENQHRAMEDCKATYACYLQLKKTASEKGILLIDGVLKSKDIIANVSNFDESHPLFGKTCVFTGKLEKLTRAEAMQIVANFGGVNADNVTKSTNFLILGNNDFCTTIKGGKSSKHKKAEKLALDGQDIQILSENVFYDMISE